MMFTPTVSRDDNIAFLGYPVARITLFKPINKKETGFPNSNTCIKSRA